MKIFNTAGLDAQLMRTLSADDAANIYNGLDCCVTFEVFERLFEELAESPANVKQTYADSLAKQSAYLEVSMRGIRIDDESRKRAQKELRGRLDLLNERFQRIMVALFDTEINWNSPMQLKTLFYGSMGLKEIRKRNAQGAYVATADEDALNKLAQNFYARPLVSFILRMKELSKKITWLDTEIDPDGRMRTNINVAGTKTGRLSSSGSDFGTGTNLQNVDNTMRYPFVADPRMVLVNIDLEQADARNVGAIIWSVFHGSHGPAEAGKYLDACESGDLHTTVCAMAWRELEWPEPWEMRAARKIADQPAYREMSYRDLAKRLGHGTNYLGTPRTMAAHTQTETKLIAEFQERYFGAFPLIQQWHEWTINELHQTGYLTTLYGRRRHFFGRASDATTHREAIAYSPQSMTGHQIDMGLMRVWREYPAAQLLMQVHDSILLQVPWHNSDTHIARVMELLRFEIELVGGRKFAVPLEAQVGWNWGKAKINKEGKIVSNPDGLVLWPSKFDRQPPIQKRLKDYL
jgi:DNA polymerase-1